MGKLDKCNLGGLNQVKIDMYTPVSMVKSDEMLSRKLQENLVCQFEFCSMEEC